MRMLYRAVRATLSFVLWCMCRHRVSGCELLPAGGALLAANHASYLDPPIVTISSPREVHFLARKSLFRWPVFGLFISALNSHPISGSGRDAASFKTVMALIDAGQYVLLFPEGYRSSDGALQPIKSGVSLLALRCRCPIVPVYIHGSYEAWPRHRRFPRWGVSTACIFGAPIDPSPYAAMEKKAGQEALSLAVGDAIAALQKEFLMKEK